MKSKRNRTVRPNKKAFTLIELLVVVTIIAILAAILFPVFGRAKEAARKTVALSNMRQLAIAVMMYTVDHDDTYVPSTNYDAQTTDVSRIWTVPIFPYVKNKDIFVSPGSETSKYAEGWSTRHQQSIGMNGATAFGTVAGGLAPADACLDGELKLGCEGFSSAVMESSLQDPSRTGFFASTPDGLPGTEYRGYVFSPDNGTTYRNDYVSFDSLEMAVPLASDRDLVMELGPTLSPGQMKPIFARYGSTGREDGTTPVIFADGHAKSYSARAIATGSSGILWRFR